MRTGQTQGEVGADGLLGKLQEAHQLRDALTKLLMERAAANGHPIGRMEMERIHAQARQQVAQAPSARLPRGCTKRGSCEASRGPVEEAKGAEIEGFALPVA